jgi:hypothetical protein
MLSIPQAQQHLYESIYHQDKQIAMQLPLLPLKVSCAFLLNILCPLTSLALHNLPHRRPSDQPNRIPNAYIMLLLQQKFCLPLGTIDVSTDAIDKYIVQYLDGPVVLY